MAKARIGSTSSLLPAKRGRCSRFNRHRCTGLTPIRDGTDRWSCSRRNSCRPRAGPRESGDSCRRSKACRERWRSGAGAPRGYRGDRANARRLLTRGAAGTSTRAAAPSTVRAAVAPCDAWYPASVTRTDATGSCEAAPAMCLRRSGTASLDRTIMGCTPERSANRSVPSEAAGAPATQPWTVRPSRRQTRRRSYASRRSRSSPPARRARPPFRRLPPAGRGV